MDLIIKDIQTRIARNKNYMGIACGEPGSGKSFAALSIAQTIDPSFNIDRIAMGNSEEFVEILNQKLKKGNVVMFDEAGVGIPTREWQSIGNKLINYILQTFRYENLVCLWTVPSFKMIDSQSRTMFYGYIEPTFIDFNRQVSIVKYMKIQYNPRGGQKDQYFHYHTRNGVPIKRVEIPVPTETLIQEYESKKKKFAAKLKSQALDEIRNLNIKKEIQNGMKIPNTQCQNCNYKWFYSGEIARSKCPNCNKYVSTRNLK